MQRDPRSDRPAFSTLFHEVVPRVWEIKNTSKSKIIWHLERYNLRKLRYIAMDLNRHQLL